MCFKNVNWNAGKQPIGVAHEIALLWGAIMLGANFYLDLDHTDWSYAHNPPSTGPEAGSYTEQLLGWL
jgi:hypothetical protein